MLKLKNEGGGLFISAMKRNEEFVAIPVVAMNVIVKERRLYNTVCILTNISLRRSSSFD